MIKVFEIPFMDEKPSNYHGPIQEAETNLNRIENDGWKIISVVGKDKRLLVIARSEGMSDV